MGEKSLIKGMSSAADQSLGIYKVATAVDPQ